MRRLLLLLSAAACAHGQRPPEPDSWHELRTEHFVLRTDLPAEDARQSAIALEDVRSALITVGWHAERSRSAPVQVIIVADRGEMQEFAAKGIEGFVGEDAFREPIVVLNGSASPRDQKVLKHELTHLITNELLVRNPRWVAEGIACYFETLQFKSGSREVETGRFDSDRTEYLRYRPVFSYWAAIRAGREVQTLSQEEGYAFETASWILVHWLIDTRPQAFQQMMAALARGEDQYYAFSSAFPDLSDAVLKPALAAYVKKENPLLRRTAVTPWTGDVAVRPVSRGEVYAILADLHRISPGFHPTPERKAREQSLVAQSLEVDPGNPLALQLSGGGDAAAATKVHPEDWRAWIVLADRNNDHAAVEKAAQLAPDNPGVLARLVWVKLARNEGESALRDAARASELAPARPDTLDAHAHALAANGRCAEADTLEQRAIDVLPDAAPTKVVRELQARQAAMSDHCAPPRRVAERTVAGKAVLKGCTGKRPKLGKSDRVRGVIQADFQIGEDGKVSSVKLSGDATPGVLSSVRKYLESCRYEPLKDGDKAVASEAHGEFQLDR